MCSASCPRARRSSADDTLSLSFKLVTVRRFFSAQYVAPSGRQTVRRLRPYIRPVVHSSSVRSVRAEELPKSELGPIMVSAFELAFVRHIHDDDDGTTTAARLLYGLVFTTRPTALAQTYTGRRVTHPHLQVATMSPCAATHYLDLELPRCLHEEKDRPNAGSPFHHNLPTTFHECCTMHWYSWRLEDHRIW